MTVPLTVNFEPLIADREILGFYNTSSLTYYEVVIPGQNGLYFVNDPTDDLTPVTPIGANYTFLKTLNYGYSNILGLVKASNSNAAYLLIMQAGDDMISPAVLNTINLNEDIYPHYDLRGPSTSIYISNGQEVKEFDALNPAIFPCDDDPSLCQLTSVGS